MRTSSVRLHTAIVVTIEVVKKDRYNYTVTRHTEYRSNAMFVRSQIIPVDYQHSDTTELDKHYSQLSW